MRYITFILWFSICEFCSAQNIRFQLYRTAACTVTEKLDTEYSIYKIPGSLNANYYPKSGTVYLPGPGKYKVELYRGPIIDTIFNIKDTGLVVYHYKDPLIGYYWGGGVDMPPQYWKCGTLMEGYQEDFYANGSLKMRGNFANGFIKDSIVTFYLNGRTEAKQFLKSHMIYTTGFDSLGRVKRVSRYQDKFGSYAEYEWTEFFPSGKVKEKKSDLKRVISIAQYYSNGQLKLEQTNDHRVEYYPSGIKKVNYTWKHTEDSLERKIGESSFTVYKKEYDRRGQIQLLIVYDSWFIHDPQPDFFTTKETPMESITKYKKGRPIFTVKGDDADAYIAKNPDKFNEPPQN